MTMFIYNIVGISYAQVENSTSTQNSVVALHQEHSKVLLFFIYSIGKIVARNDNK
jgi:DNA-binding winged helix-turn-helix (wHTH) protein